MRVREETGDSVRPMDTRGQRNLGDTRYHTRDRIRHPHNTNKFQTNDTTHRCPEVSGGTNHHPLHPLRTAVPPEYANPRPSPETNTPPVGLATCPPAAVPIAANTSISARSTSKMSIQVPAAAESSSGMSLEGVRAEERLGVGLGVEVEMVPRPRRCRLFAANGKGNSARERKRVSAMEGFQWRR